MNLSDRISILYAEDNEDAALMLKTLLGFSGIEVSPVQTVETAFQAAQNKYFDLYLLDNRFSDGSGLELCQRLRKLNPQTPVVFYSGAAYQSDIQKALAAGAQAYLIKPNCDAVAPTIFELVKCVPEAA